MRNGELRVVVLDLRDGRVLDRGRPVMWWSAIFDARLRGLGAVVVVVESAVMVCLWWRKLGVGERGRRRHLGAGTLRMSWREALLIVF